MSITSEITKVISEFQWSDLDALHKDIMNNQFYGMIHSKGIRPELILRYLFKYHHVQTKNKQVYDWFAKMESQHSIRRLGYLITIKSLFPYPANLLCDLCMKLPITYRYDTNEIEEFLKLFMMDTEFNTTMLMYKEYKSAYEAAGIMNIPKSVAESYKRHCRNKISAHCINKNFSIIDIEKTSKI